MAADTTMTADTSKTHSQTAFTVLWSLSFCHLLNDMMQSLISALYPMLKESFHLDFGQIGILTLAFQATASVLQPVVGIVADKYRQPFSLALSMAFTGVGLLLLSQAGVFWQLTGAACIVGMGSAIFHPNSSRVARMASGGRHGLAQSLFQVGGNFGQALGPLLAAFIVLPRGQGSVAFFAAAALVAMFVLWRVGYWSKAHMQAQSKRRAPAHTHDLPRGKVVLAISILVLLMFSKFVYTSSLSSYYTFYLIEKFHLSVQEAQVQLFIFLGAVAAGTILGGPIGDRFGRKYVIWGSILGVLPFTMALPYANFTWTVVLAVVIGLVLSSAFSAIVVFGQELVPTKVGMMAGMFFGFAFGIGGIGAAVLGEVADHYGIEFVYKLCAFLPAIGLLAIFLPNIEKPKPLVR